MPAARVHVLTVGCSSPAERKVGMHVLDLGNNSMTAEGAASLAAYMEKHRELKDLNLYMNDIGSAGLEKVLLCLRSTHGFALPSLLSHSAPKLLSAAISPCLRMYSADCGGAEGQPVHRGAGHGRQQHHGRRHQGAHALHLGCRVVPGCTMAAKTKP